MNKVIVLIKIYYTSFTEQLSQNIFNEHLFLLPVEQQEKNNRFVRWQDKYLHLLGKLLLIEGLKSYGLSDRLLEKLQYNKYGKPFLQDKGVDFNISHSGYFAICAISSTTSVGVDLEKMGSVDFNDYKKVFTEHEWRSIEGSPQPLTTFFTFWSRKESVIKADGRGISIPLNSIDVLNDFTRFEDQVWYLKDIFINEDYSACVASNRICDTSLVKMEFFN